MNSRISKLGYLAALLTLSATTLMIARPSKADFFSDIDPTSRNSQLRRGLRSIDPTNPIPQRTRTWFEIHFKNSCTVPIAVAINKYYPADPGGGSGSESGTMSITPEKWVPEGWWRIEPGQTLYVADQIRNRNLYYYAESIGEPKKVWTGNDTSGKLRGRTLSFKQVDMGANLNNYTMNLTCN